MRKRPAYQDQGMPDALHSAWRKRYRGAKHDLTDEEREAERAYWRAHLPGGVTPLKEGPPAAAHRKGNRGQRLTEEERAALRAYQQHYYRNVLKPARTRRRATNHQVTPPQLP